MKKLLLILSFFSFVMPAASGQVEPNAGTWKTWFITSGNAYRLAAPTSSKEDVQQIITAQQNVDSAALQKILFWNAGSPGYRWYAMMGKLWTTDVSGNGALANMLLGTAVYDATIAAWDTKYAHNRSRPYEAEKKVKLLIPAPSSPSYPCEHSVAAGVAVTLISHFYPKLADSVKRMADQVMSSRIAAGVAYPGDTRAGFELGKKIAEKEIEMTKDYVTTKVWDGKIPQGPGFWTGKMPMMPMAGYSKTVVLDSASQYRPAAPPDFAKEMDELRNFKQTFRSKANAWYYAGGTGDDVLSKKIMEYGLDHNPPRAARIYAAINVAYYDAFTACWDAKYTYWGIRPDQYDPNYKPLIPTPPFPGYPSGHATISGVVGEMFSYFFPLDKALFQKIAVDGAESRFHAGIHFRSDNEAGLEIGRKVSNAVLARIKTDGADLSPLRRTDLKAKK